MKISILALSLTVLCLGCTSDSPTSNNNNKIDETILQSSYEIPIIIYQIGEQQVERGVQAVFAASILNGGNSLVTTGTLTQDNIDISTFSYSDTPTDMLRIIFNDNSTVEYIYSKFNGNLSGDYQTFLSNNYELSFRVISTELDLEINLLTLNGNRHASTLGQIFHNEIMYKVDLGLNGTYYFDVDNTGSELRVNDQYNGKVESSETVFTVDENWIYNSVYSTSSRKFAESWFRTFNSLFEYESKYQFMGTIQASFVDGLPTDWQPGPPEPYWVVNGELRQNDETIRQLKISLDPTGVFLRIVLVDANGEIYADPNDVGVVLQTWRIF